MSTERRQVIVALTVAGVTLCAHPLIQATSCNVHPVYLMHRLRSEGVVHIPLVIAVVLFVAGW